MYQTPPPEPAATVAVDSPTLRALYLQQRAARETVASRGLADIITYDLATTATARTPVTLSRADVVSAAAYNLVSDARAGQGDVLSVLTGGTGQRSG